MKVLIVLTSHSELGNTGKKTGFWIEEFAAPYYAFLEAGISVVLASPKGGHPPIDPKSDESSSQTPATIRFKADGDLQTLLSHTKKLTDVFADDFDAIFNGAWNLSILSCNAKFYFLALLWRYI